MHKLKSGLRTHTCGELRSDSQGETVTLSGWILRKRDHGGVVFVDLRDHYGLTQVVFAGEFKERIQNTRVESVVHVTGEVRARDKELINPKLATGEIEVHCTELNVLTECAVLPFQIAEDDNAPEATRLTHRFLELRREELHNNIILRSKVIHSIREAMIEEGFLEYQTPILTSSSPEGARDYLVPSRLHPGKFFALPQAPQQFKQLIMVAGFDRYFQIAPCFRDEDPRADRSPGEFYQLDMEMSFVDQDDVLGVNERAMNKVFSLYSGGKAVTKTPFPRMSYDESFRRYGTDKPDLRIPLEIEDVSEVFKSSEFRVFQQAVEQGGGVFAIKLPVDEIPPRKYFDDSIDYFKKASGKGLAYLSFSPDGEVKGVIKKFLSEDELSALRNTLGLDSLHSVFFAAGDPKEILPHFGRLLTKLGGDFNLVDDTQFKFCWITDFPLFEWNEQEKKIDFGHNPFSMPRGGMEALENQDPLEIYSSQYDLVCNGYELGSGAIRNHLPDVMYKAFEIAGYSKEVVDEKFGGMKRAFEFGPPPHGGFAHGVDRIVMLLAGQETIRDVIMFPLAQTGEDLMMGAPSDVFEQQLKEAHIQLDLPSEIDTE